MLRQRAGGAGQHPECGYRSVARFSIEKLEGGADPVGIEQRPLAPHPCSHLGQSEEHATAVGIVFFPEHEAEPDQAGELNRDRRRGDSEPAGELSRCNGLRGIEVFENAGEVVGQSAASGLISNAPAAPSGVESRVRRQHGVHLGVEHTLK